MIEPESDARECDACARGDHAHCTQSRHCECWTEAGTHTESGGIGR